ncbi:MAG: 3-phosphoserine/phosphohydroxythreonine transaminase [Sphingomonadales bacterium]|nr:3-phosphoserine/phosphohydroxythreonine transaminase [Sphingomonadales bacterium]
MKLHNFNAGPSALPVEVIEQAAQALHNFNDSGLSLLEIGHRTSLFVPVIEEARHLVRELMQLDADHEVLLLHGGATLQFLQVPMNLLDSTNVASYTETGTWSQKAIKEAALLGEVSIAGSSADDRFTSIPSSLQIDPRSRYLHITTNETIAGTQWHRLPYDCTCSLVADMSSDILSRSLDFNRFDLIYAGAQKNMGAAGVTLVVVNKNCLGKLTRTIPTFLDYRSHIKEGSMLNTPPVFAVYVLLLTLRWLKAKGGVAAMEKNNLEKANLLYDTLEQSPLFSLPVKKEDRSLMNAVFLVKDAALEKEFAATAKAEGMIGIEGHRSVGGFRVSLYNAISLASVQALVDFINAFARKKS